MRLSDTVTSKEPTEKQDTPKRYFTIWKNYTGCMSTYKTNSTQLNLVNHYKHWVTNHLLKEYELVLILKMIIQFEESNKLIDKAKTNLSSQEEQFMSQSLATWVILSPKLLIKHQKRINRKGNVYNQIDYTCNKLYLHVLQSWITWDINILDKVKVNYSRFTMVQASELKYKLEEIGVNRDKATLAPIDAINM